MDDGWRTSKAPLTAEYRIIRPDGTIRRILRRASAIRNAEGRPVRLLGIVQDVTDQYLERQERIASEERYRLLFDKNPVPLWVFDEESMRFLDVNEAAIRHYGFSRDEFLGMTILDIRPAEDVPRLMQNRATAARGYRVVGGWRHLRKDGTIIDVDIVRHQFVLEGRSVQLVMAIDITERLRAERDLRESRAELERFSEKLQSAIEEERARISREIHDELGQSLTGLRMYAAILESRLGDRADLVTQTAAMTAIIDETVRTVRRIATELRPGVLDAFGLVAATEWAVHDFTTRSGVRADFVNHLNFEPELGGERDTHVFRVVQEALTNVARHSEAGSVAIELAEGPGELIVRVQDDGRGFDAGPTAAHASLGLLGMRERARMLGGILELESESGRGTRITLHVPHQPRGKGQ
jgi:PAS domain S-box-containing protein